MKKILAVFTLSLILLAACGSDKEPGGETASVGELFEEGSLPSDIPEGYECPQISQPVCAGEKTYLNACEAATNGQSTWSNGACE